VDELARFAPIEVTLRNSRRVRLREIRPDDRDEVQQAFGRLSSESRYMRFMSFLKELSPRMLEEVSSLRVVLEQFAMRQLRGRITPAARAELAARYATLNPAQLRRDLDHALERLWRLAAPDPLRLHASPLGNPNSERPIPTEGNPDL